jgi:hypothetical protein
MILITAREWTGRFVMNFSNLPIYRIINIIHHLLLNMKVEIEMYIHEDDETVVMQKVSHLIKQAKEAGFQIGEIEFKGSKHKENEDKHHNKHHNEDNRDSIE